VTGLLGSDHQELQYCGERLKVSYIERSLDEGEQIIYRTGLHWVTLFPSALFCLVFMGIGALLALGSWKVGLPIIAISILVPSWALIVRNGTKMVITDRRIIIKKGLIGRQTVEISRSKLESVRVDQNLFGRVLDYGTIIVIGTGSTHEPFRKVRSPIEFRRQLTSV
jgi:hypothetical protein